MIANGRLVVPALMRRKADSSVYHKQVALNFYRQTRVKHSPTSSNRDLRDEPQRPILRFTYKVRRFIGAKLNRNRSSPNSDNLLIVKNR